jgi:hypothetical protein
VEIGSQLYFVRYQFDNHDRPLPVIKRILTALGSATDPWEIAACSHYPNHWLDGEDGTRPITPKDALCNLISFVAVAREFRGTFVV